MKKFGKLIAVVLALVMLTAAVPTAFAAKVSAPATLSISNQSNGLRAQWSAVSGAAKYIVYFRQAGESWSSDETSGTSYTLTEAASGVLYYMQVQSVAPDGEKGGYSKVRSMTALSRAVIADLRYQGDVTLNWEPVEGANRYQIAELKKGASSYTYYTTADTAFTQRNAEAGTVYTYQVRAMYQTERNGTAYGAWSSGKTVSTMTKPVLTLSNKSNGIRAEWKAVAGATSYKVYYRLATDSQWSSAETTNLYYPLLGIKPGFAYCLQIQVLGKNGAKGPYSTVQRLVYVPTVKPSLTLSNKSNGIRAEWNAIAGATGYIVYFRNEFDPEWDYDYTTNNYYPLLYLTRDDTYCVQVQPVYQDETGNYSAVKRLQYSPVSTGKPVLRIFNDEKGIVIDWVPTEGAVSYILYYRESSSNTWNQYLTSPIGVLFTDVVKGVSYDFQLQPVFYGGVRGAYSKVYHHVYGDVEKPALTAQRIDDTLHMEWTPVKNATKYRVFVRDHGTVDESWAAFFTPGTTFDIYGIDAEASFDCVVAPYYGETQGVHSNFVTLYGEGYSD